MSLTDHFHTGQRQDSGKVGPESMVLHSQVSRRPVGNGQYVIWEPSATHFEYRGQRPLCCATHVSMHVRATSFRH